MQSPVKKEFITQVFGVNYDAYKRFGLKGHNGIDYRAFLPNGERCYEGGKSEVFAPHDGVIVENALDSGYGWYIKIENEKEGSVLAHFSSQSPLKVRTKVKQGQFVGYQGTTGNSTGIHLHWGYYRLPRDRANGYAGFINQAGLYGPFGEPEREPTMSQLLTYLGISDEAAAITTLTEHLGSKDGKCQWGSADAGGGHLGSERRKVAKLETRIGELTTEADVAYQKGLADGKAINAGVVTNPPTIEGWSVNGLQVSVGDKTWNYQKNQ